MKNQLANEIKKPCEYTEFAKAALFDDVSTLSILTQNPAPKFWGNFEKGKGTANE